MQEKRGCDDGVDCKCWVHVVTDLSVLILCSLKVHQMAEVADALAYTGTNVLCVLGGCAGVACQHYIRTFCSKMPQGDLSVQRADQKRHTTFERAMGALGNISLDTIKNTFVKSQQCHRGVNNVSTFAKIQELLFSPLRPEF